MFSFYNLGHWFTFFLTLEKRSKHTGHKKRLVFCTNQPERRLATAITWHPHRLQLFPYITFSTSVRIHRACSQRGSHNLPVKM